MTGSFMMRFISRIVLVVASMRVDSPKRGCQSASHFFAMVGLSVIRPLGGGVIFVLVSSGSCLMR